MSNLQHRQSKMQAKRKHTPYRDFVMEIASRIPLNFYKNCGVVSRYPVSDRVSQVISMGDLINKRNEDDIVGQGYDNNQSFLEQVQSLMQQSLLPGTWEFMSSDNSSYSDCVGGTKNAYLSFLCSMDVENILYSFVVRSNVVDCISSLYVVDHSSNVYQSCSIAHSYNIFYSFNINNCANIWFSSNLYGCQECVMCDGLENVSYHINNIGYSKEEYFAQKSVILAEKQTFDSKYQNINRRGTNIACNNCEGNFLVECDDVTQGLLSAHIKTGHNVILSGGSQTCEFAYDTIQGVAYNHSYGTVGMALGDHYYSCAHLLGNNMYYSTLCSNCSFCLGCVGLKDKSYYILNKQYSKEDWYEKVDEIFGQMDKDGTLGQFFPASMNPFYFNDTAAYLIDLSFTKEEVTAAGYLRRDEPISVDIPEWMEIIPSDELGQFEKIKDGVRTIDPIILKKTIRDEEGNIYRVIKMEYDFLVKYGLPLPRKHWLTRMKENFSTN